MARLVQCDSLTPTEYRACQPLRIGSLSELITYVIDGMVVRAIVFIKMMNSQGRILIDSLILLMILRDVRPVLIVERRHALPELPAPLITGGWSTNLLTATYHLPKLQST